MSQSFYRAVHAVRPGQLELTEKPVTAPGPGDVRIRVQTCGVCHSDAATVEGVFAPTWPRVPGHEVIGRIDALGEGVKGWKIGDHVGVGFLGGSCGYCARCRAGDLVTCTNQDFTGVQRDGGYAEMMTVRATGLVSVPDGITDIDAAPLLCAGLTTFSALRNSPARAGDLVAVLGIGGLGHLGVQYAKHMGFEVVAMGRGPDRDGLAKKLGAHHYVDTTSAAPAESLQALGGASLVLATASAGTAVADTVKGLKPRGRVIVLGASSDPIQVSGNDLLFASRSIDGALTGDPATGDTTLRFSVLTGIRPVVETMPLGKAPEAYARMMAGKARLRLVLTMEQ